MLKCLLLPPLESVHCGVEVSPGFVDEVGAAGVVLPLTGFQTTRGCVGFVWGPIDLSGEKGPLMSLVCPVQHKEPPPSFVAMTNHFHFISFQIFLFTCHFSISTESFFFFFVKLTTVWGNYYLMSQFFVLVLSRLLVICTAPLCPLVSGWGSVGPRTPPLRPGLTLKRSWRLALH